MKKHNVKILLEKKGFLHAMKAGKLVTGVETKEWLQKIGASDWDNKQAN